MQINFEQAEKLFDNGFYDKSFEMFGAIAKNEKYDLHLRAEAYNMMGVIISGFAPYLSRDDDESGLTFFRKSLQTNPQNLSAALNIIENYNNSPTSHHDKIVTKVACLSLRNNFWEELSDSTKEKINKIEKTL